MQPAAAISSTTAIALISAASDSRPVRREVHLLQIDDRQLVKA
jgi:hypothetical protein